MHAQLAHLQATGRPDAGNLLCWMYVRISRLEASSFEENSCLDYARLGRHFGQYHASLLSLHSGELANLETKPSSVLKICLGTARLHLQRERNAQSRHAYRTDCVRERSVCVWSGAWYRSHGHVYVAKQVPLTLAWERVATWPYMIQCSW